MGNNSKQYCTDTTFVCNKLGEDLVFILSKSKNIKHLKYQLLVMILIYLYLLKSILMQHII